MPVNSIVVAACLEWMQRHTPDAGIREGGPLALTFPASPRWATIRRAIRQSGGARGMYPFERFSEHAKTLLTITQAEAEKAGFNFIGTEHMLLATVGKPDFHSARILSALGVTEADLRTAIESAITRKEGRQFRGMIPTSRVKKVIEIAFQLRSAQGQTHVGTDHILLALSAEGEGIAAHVLEDLGATRKLIETEAAKLTEPES